MQGQGEVVTSGVRAGLGASSSSFWLRRWMLQSLSPSGLVSHHADLVGLRANEVNSMIIADVHKSGIFR
ncbi:MAG: hypothetical protein FRX49_10648 [Trebouxia sp. A1-2]|nr:MAG: hypothetical protein FRX49_10648 [Trebouxia sp. A1-2]